MEDRVKDLQNAALSAAADHIRGQRVNMSKYRFRAVCITVVACVALVCAVVLACFSIHAQQQTIIEQQYALNMQYAQIMDYLRGAEVTIDRDTAEASGDGSISVAGDNNTTAGGDVNAQ